MRKYMRCVRNIVASLDASIDFEKTDNQATAELKYDHMHSRDHRKTIFYVYGNETACVPAVLE